MSNRDEFSERTKRLLAYRVGMRCSNPCCRVLTCAANTHPNKVVNIGVAAHICAAAAGGPRYDRNMTSNERKSPQNGIWLCQSCAKLIDSDPTQYTTEILHHWKDIAESLASHEIQKPVLSTQNEINSIAGTILSEKFADRWFPNRELLQHRQILWGCKKVDDLSKISLGSVILIAGYANSGKHLYLQNVVRANIRNDNRIIYFSLKEPSYTVINMMLAAESMVNLEKLRTGMLTSDEWSRIAEAATLLEKGKFLLELYQPSDILNQYILSAIRCGNADIVIIDDLGGLGLANNSAVTSFMYHLRRAAAESGTIIFIVKDITVIPSRIDRRPLISDPQINDLCRLSDVVQFLYHDENEIFTEDEDSIKIELIMAKNYTSTVPRVVHLIGLPSYSILIDAQEGISSATKSIDKYSGIIAGLKTISEYLE